MLYQCIRENAARRPHDIAFLRFPGTSLSFASWWEEACSLAALIPESRDPRAFLAVQLTEDSDLPLAVLAAWIKGVALFPLSPDLRQLEIEALFRESGPPLALWRELPARGKTVEEPRFSGPESLALLLATSGSTAQPKIFAFRHRELFAAGEIEARQWEKHGVRRTLNVRPSFTSGGTNTLWPAFFGGWQLAYATREYRLPRWEALSQLVARLEPSLVVASPSYLRALLSEGSGSLPSLGSTRLLFYGGDRLRDIENRAFREAGLIPFMRYGMTECAHILCLQAMDESVPSPGVGEPVCPCRVVDEQLEFSSPGFAGWRLRNGRMVPSQRDGWYRTDDRGFLRDGMLFLEGRGARQMVVSGFRVSAAEVEDCLLSSGLLSDCVVLGLPDPIRGQKIAALVIPRPGAEGWEARLKEHCRTRLSHPKVPHRFQETHEIPRMPNGKRNWLQIRDLLLGASAPLNLWEMHFKLAQKLRKGDRWRARPELANLCRHYNFCLEEELSVAEIAELEAQLASAPTGKYVLYQAIWSWNALAYQKYRFQQDLAGAHRALAEGLRLASRLPRWSSRKHGPCAEAVWLILLLNQIRLHFRAQEREQANRLLQELRNYLQGDGWDPGAFGGDFARAFADGAYRFSYDPELVTLLLRKLEAEEKGASSPRPRSEGELVE